MCRRFARVGRRTLAVDCDAQADLTRWLLGPSDQDAADLEAIVAGGALRGDLRKRRSARRLALDR